MTAEVHTTPKAPFTEEIVSDVSYAREKAAPGFGWKYLTNYPNPNFPTLKRDIKPIFGRYRLLIASLQRRKVAGEILGYEMGIDAFDDLDGHALGQDTKAIYILPVQSHREEKPMLQ